MPFGQVPGLILDIPNNEPIYMNQSKAICRWLAISTDLNKKITPWSKMLIDIIVGTIEDFLQGKLNYLKHC